MKLHLAPGLKRIPGFVHVDARPEVRPEVVADITQGLPMFDDCSAELVYWSHGLEHVRRPDIDRVLKDLYRICAPGWSLRLAMPDLSTLIAGWSSGVFKYDQIIGPLYGRQDYPENTHYYAYTFRELEARLRKAGFDDWRPYDPREVWYPGFDDCSLAIINGVNISLNVEAHKS